MERESKESEAKIKAKIRKFPVKPLAGHRPTAAFLAALRAVVAMARNEA